MPTATIKGSARTRQSYLPAEMASLLLPYREGSLVVLEDVHSFPQMGVVSAFELGRGKGIWMGILGALGIPYELVSPQQWKKDILSGRAKEKEAARIKAQELYPNLIHMLQRKMDHNRADALLLAHWGLEKIVGRPPLLSGR